MVKSGRDSPQVGMRSTSALTRRVWTVPVGAVNTRKQASGCSSLAPWPSASSRFALSSLHRIVGHQHATRPQLTDSQTAIQRPNDVHGVLALRGWDMLADPRHSEGDERSVLVSSRPTSVVDSGMNLRASTAAILLFRECTDLLLLLPAPWLRLAAPLDAAPLSLARRTHLTLQ